MKTINELAKEQFEWVEAMGWHNKTVLEMLALVASEVGEAINECRHEDPTDNFKDELADIILRTIDIAETQNIDIYQAIIDKMNINRHRGTRGRRV